MGLGVWGFRFGVSGLVFRGWVWDPNLPEEAISGIVSIFISQNVLINQF